jgi:hypothetical protein
LGRSDWSDFLVAGVIVIVSFTPLIQAQGWQALPSPGGYSCSCGQYFVSYSATNYGGDKPHIYTNYQGYQIDVLEVSDKQSTVNGLDMYSNFTETTNLAGGMLSADYASPGLTFSKTVSLNGSTLSVGYSFSRSVNASITLWRWYFASVSGFDLPITRDLGPLGSVGYTFLQAGAEFNAMVSATPGASDVQISGVPGAGLNKMTMEFSASKIDLSIRLESIRTLAGAGVSSVGSSTIAYPIIGTSSAVMYLALRKRIVGKPK